MNDLILCDLYAATAEPGRWGAVLKRLTETVGGARACFVKHKHMTAVGQDDGLLMERLPWGLPAEATGRCNLHEPLVGEGKTSAARTPAGGLSVLRRGLEAGHTFRPGEFQFLRNDRVGHVAVALVHDSAALSRYFIIERTVDDGRFPPSDERRLREIGPHLVRAVGLSQKFLELRAQRQCLSDALDRARYGVLLMAPGQLISWKNRAAKDILGACDGLMEGNGGLKATTPTEDRRLRRLFSSLENPARLSSVGVRVSRPSGRKPYLVLACRVCSDFSTNHPPSDVAMLIVHDPEVMQALSTARLIELFNLTPAEAYLAASLIGGKKLDELAAQRSVKLSTVRSQLRAVLAKTEVAGQVDLIRLLSPLPML